MLTINRMSFLLGLFFLFIPFLSYGAEKQNLSAKEIYELQEKCAKNSAEFFKKIYGSGYDEKESTQTYECHYNKKLNKCYIKINFLSEEEDKLKLTMVEFYDVLENNKIAFFANSSNKISCFFYGSKCKSLEELITLITPYMIE